MFPKFRWPSSARTIDIDGREDVWSVAFLADGQQIASGGSEGKIRRWRAQDGGEAGSPMDPGSSVFNIAVSHDGKWVATGTWSGWLTVWNAKLNHKKGTDLSAHNGIVRAVDISHDGTRIVTGSEDSTVCIWSLADGQRLLGPLQHEDSVCAAKFSPNGRFIATATFGRASVHVYDSHRGTLLQSFSIKVGSVHNQSLAWARDSKQLFVLSEEGFVHCLHAATGRTLSRWPIHGSKAANCITLASNGRFIAASAGSSVSFWDPQTRKQVGSTIDHSAKIESMAISSSYSLVTANGRRISLHALREILPTSYCDDVTPLPEDVVDESDSANEQGLRIQLAEAQHEVQSLRSQEETLSGKVAGLEEIVKELRELLTQARHAADGQSEINNSLRVELYTQTTSFNERVENFETAVTQLESELTSSQQAVKQQKDDLARSLDAQESSQRKVTDLEAIVEQLRNELADSQRALANAQARESSNDHTEGHIAEKLRDQLSAVNQEKDSLRCIIHAHEQKHEYEALYSQGLICDAADNLLASSLSEDVKPDKFLSDWLANFTQRCVTELDRVGDGASDTKKATAAYSRALLLSPSAPTGILVKLARIFLASGTAQDTLSAYAKFKVPGFLIYHATCDVLEENSRLTEAVECYRQMQDNLPIDAGVQDERTQWEHDFRGRCAGKLESLGDTAKDSRKHDDAVKYYTHALLLDPPNANDVLLKRSNLLIELDPSSHDGFKGKHAALHGIGHYKEAFEAFRTMLSILNKSRDPRVRELRSQYVDATQAIKNAVKDVTRDMPSVLIDTKTGCLYDKAKQNAAFEVLQMYDELRSSMTTPARLDHPRIRREVRKFYRYVMLSHRWRSHEPTLQMVEKETSVYMLSASTENSKVKQFCKVANSLCFHWAWTDTCCINQQDKRVLEESVVAMFKWYSGSSLTVVYLHDVPSEFDTLWKSIWNTRGWTYQEYVASKVVQFYTADWKPYLGLPVSNHPELTVFNHKESPEILSEMERATHFTAKDVATLRPGLDRVREKLYLASMRQTEREEDIAYCLFGIFKTALPVIYGEGNLAVGRLLEHVLTGSGDAMILAWTGRSGAYNSCLPADLSVYNIVVPPHAPQHIEKADIIDMAVELQSSLPHHDIPRAVALYDELKKLVPPFIAAGRLQLSGIVFPITELVRASQPHNDSKHVYHATATGLGSVEIRTADDLPEMEGYLLIHPWISSLFDSGLVRRGSGIDARTNITPALHLIIRLRQPFGALLLAPISHMTQYRRVAADDLISVRMREETPLDELIKGIETVNIQ